MCVRAYTRTTHTHMCMCVFVCVCVYVYVCAYSYPIHWFLKFIRSITTLIFLLTWNSLYFYFLRVDFSFLPYYLISKRAVKIVNSYTYYILCNWYPYGYSALKLNLEDEKWVDCNIQIPLNPKKYFLLRIK